MVVKGLSVSFTELCLTEISVMYGSERVRLFIYVALFWRNSTMARLPDVLPAGHGWQLDGETFSVVWYEGPHTPLLTCSK